MKRIYLVFLVVMFSGCASIRAPRDLSDNVVIGKIELSVVGTNPINGISLNGDYLDGIVLEAMNYDTDEIYKTRTNKSGYFMFYSLPAGKYLLKEAKKAVKIKNITAFIDSHENPPYFFEADENVIANLGVIKWKYTPYRQKAFEQEESYVEVKDFFLYLDEKCKWNGFIWKEQSLSLF